MCICLSLRVLGNNFLTGSLPNEWGNLSSLNFLFMQHNQLSGTLPPSWGAMPLLILHLGNNSLSGSLPPQWGELTDRFTDSREMLILNLENNNLSGPLPAQWSSMSFMRALLLANNQLTGSLPVVWRHMGNRTNDPKMSLEARTSLFFQTETKRGVQSIQQKITLDSAKGALPVQWSDREGLLVLDLHNNTLQGTLPPQWGGMHLLSGLALSSNRLSGPLPTQWSAVTNISKLYLANNNLTGTLPESWASLTNLTILDLSANGLSGTLPSSWASLRQLYGLGLSSNALSGPLPLEWSHMKQLRWLLLGRNSLSGTIPAAWGASNLGLLGLLGLEETNLSGRCPTQLLYAPVEMPLLSDGVLGQVPTPLRGMFAQQGAQATTTLGGKSNDREAEKVVLRGNSKGRGKLILLNHTLVDLPTVLQLHKVCSDMMRQKSMFYLTYKNSKDYWCGRNEGAQAQVVGLWVTFAVLMGLIAMVKISCWWRQKSHSQVQGQSRIQGLGAAGYHSPCFAVVLQWVRPHLSRAKQLWVKHLYLPCRLALTCYDMISDILTAQSMYHAWTFWLVVTGLFLPTLICSITICTQIGSRLRRRGVPLLGALLGGVLLLSLMVPIFPGLLVCTVFLRTRALLKTQGRQASLPLETKAGPGLCNEERKRTPTWIVRFGLVVRLEKVLVLFSGVTACTEDVFSSVFTSVGYILMNQNPIQTMDIQIYFPVWIFWMSMVTSMCHMLWAWWEGIDSWLQVGHLGWVREAFRGLLCEPVEEEMEGMQKAEEVELGGLGGHLAVEVRDDDKELPADAQVHLSKASAAVQLASQPVDVRSQVQGCNDCEADTEEQEFEAFVVEGRKRFGVGAASGMVW